MTVLVVAGIDTDVGKTLVSAIVTEALDGCYWKPVLSLICSNNG
ncbi:MAG: AAA family ATPase [Chlamydiales bacterium]